MNDRIEPATLAVPERRVIQALFVIAAIWNFAGSIPGIANPSGMFAQEFGRDLSDPVMVAVYRGAWVTSFLYALGFLLVARNPERHAGIVLMGGLGKALFAMNLAWMYLSGWTSDFAVVVIVGDAVFVTLFLIYLFRLRRAGFAVL
ncbi:hypothetical protein [Phenylobacterium sp.]|jgi:hypothetical protein|uniref:hypothetical protein n=1 Tax=Phenylobacterium sp. TaxID=1871053 RepID=UPI0037C9A839